MPQETVASVFRCVASRNKQGRCYVFLMTTSFGNYLLRFEEPRGPDASPSGGPQTHYVRCVPPGRPTRPKAQPILCPHSARFVLGVPPRAANASLLPRTAVPLGIALFALSFSSSPPAVSATSPVELQPAAWGGSGPRDPLGRRSTAQFSELRSVAHSPEALRAWATRPATLKGRISPAAQRAARA